MAISGRV